MKNNTLAAMQSSARDGRDTSSLLRIVTIVVTGQLTFVEVQQHVIHRAIRVVA